MEEIGPGMEKVMESLLAQALGGATPRGAGTEWVDAVPGAERMLDSTIGGLDLDELERVTQGVFGPCVSPVSLMVVAPKESCSKDRSRAALENGKNNNHNNNTKNNRVHHANESEQQPAATTENNTGRRSVEASRFCHCCARSGPHVKFRVCSNFYSTGKCRKVLCEKCAAVYEEMDNATASASAKGTTTRKSNIARKRTNANEPTSASPERKTEAWTCPHCNNRCLMVSRCRRIREAYRKQTASNSADASPLASNPSTEANGLQAYGALGLHLKPGHAVSTQRRSSSNESLDPGHLTGEYSGLDLLPEALLTRGSTDLKRSADEHGNSSVVPDPVALNAIRTMSKHSKFCHGCARNVSTDAGDEGSDGAAARKKRKKEKQKRPFVVCNGVPHRRCHKVFCNVCSVHAGWDFAEISARALWTCPHCLGVPCPPNMRCHRYKGKPGSSLDQPMHREHSAIDL